MTATALQFEFEFDAPARRLPVRRPTALTLVSGDRRLASSQRLTFDDVIVERWERLGAGRAADCLVCGHAMDAAGACASCGSVLS